MTVKALMPVRIVNLVAPLAHEATDMHAHAAAVSAAKDAEIAELKLLLRLALPHVQYGASRYYDGTNGIARRNDASDLVKRIHAARAALGDKP